MTDETQRLTVFVSYSRADVATADVIVAGLEAAGFRALIDRRDLPYGEKWQDELAGFIAAADTVIWLVSPRSVVSKWCNWELDEVAKQHKRLVPVKVGDVAPEDLPRQLGAIHILPAEGIFVAETHMSVLSQVLETDRDWVREHTRLLDRSIEWEDRDRTPALLLRGRALKDAEAWLAAQPARAPKPSPRILDLIVTSETAAKRRQRQLVGGLVAGLIGAIALAGYAYWQSIVAREQTVIATEQRQKASREIALSGWRSFVLPSQKCVDFRGQTEDKTGLYVAYCYLRSVLNYTDLEDLAGMPVFLSGPHRDGKLRMTALQFGHYNPDMIDWVGENMLPSWSDERYLSVAQPIYDQFMQTVGRAYHRAFVAWASHLPAFRHEQRLLLEHVARTEGWKKLATGRFVSPHRERVLGLDVAAEGLVGDQVYTALAFWVRRSADGTADKLFAHLDRAVQLYDPDWHATAPRPPGNGPWLPLPAALSDPAPDVVGVELFPKPWVEDIFPNPNANAILIFE